MTAPLLTLVVNTASDETLMRDALIGAGTSVWEWNVQTDEISGIEGSIAMLGYAPAELAATQDAWNRVIHPEDLANNHATYERHARGETAVYESEYRARAHDGQWRWLSERGRIVERGADGRPLRMVGTLSDISQRRAAEGAVLEMAERLRKVARHVPGVVFQYRRRADGSAHFPYVSDSCLAVTGLAPELLMDDAAPFLRRTERDDRGRLMGLIEQSLRTLRPWHCEFRLHKPDRQVRWMTGSASPQREADGTVLWHGYMQDSTDLHALEQERHARTTAEAASSAKSAFLSRMSHELRTPLNAVLGFSELMQLDMQEPLGEKQSKRVALIRDAGTHLLDMIGELLDLTRIESGKLAVDLVEVTLAPLIDECQEMLRPQADARAITLRAPGGDTRLQVRADALRLKQVLLNLLGNAIKYNRPGGSVQVTLEAQPGHVAVHVSDTGMGIASVDLPRLFVPFERLAHQHGAIEGTGIGLAVTRSLVVLMRGHLAVRSVEGVGSIFSVILPAADAAPGGDQLASLPT
jgi:PAS domain S-box-containing protein